MRATPLAFALVVLALDGPVAAAASLQLVVGRAVLPLQAPDGFAQARLTLVGPDGSVTERASAARDSTRLDAGISAPRDGVYRYRVDFDRPRPAAATTSSESSDGRGVAAGPAWPTLSGQFSLRSSELVVAASEAQALEPNDQVIADDLVVQGSGCFGLDCVNNETFGFDTIRLKENNARIGVNDTSAEGFPGTDWQLTFNDAASGGANKFAVEDITAATVPFTISGGAPTHALFVDSTGRLGVGTATPVLRLHVSGGDTPAARLEQTTASGFTAQSWDIAGNEANFFVRDVTGGARLPLRIRPGAPTSSLDISATGSVGMGTASPQARLDVQANAVIGTPVAALRVSNGDASVPAGTTDRFTVDSAGNVTARGTISQLSSRTAKENFADASGPLLLARLETLRVPTWNYLGASRDERHIGPVAEDFHAAFEVGGDPRFLAPADVAGVALASVKALQDEVKQRDAQIADLQTRLARLEALLAQPR